MLMWHSLIIPNLVLQCLLSTLHKIRVCKPIDHLVYLAFYLAHVNVVALLSRTGIQDMSTKQKVEGWVWCVGAWFGVIVIFGLEMEQAENDPEVQVLARQFKSVAGDLISLLQQVLTTFLLVCIPNFALWSSPYSYVLFMGKDCTDFYLPGVLQSFPPLGVFAE